jgi:hypothetical protein
MMSQHSDGNSDTTGPPTGGPFDAAVDGGTGAPYAQPGGLGQRAAVIAFMLGGVLILALGFWLGTRPRPPAAPQLTLVEPAPGALVDQPVQLVFDVDRARIRIGPGGWGYGTMHLHVMIDDFEVMPGPDDIEYVGSPSRYRWTLPATRPGERTLRLIWSDLQHQPVAEGASDAVRVRIR